MRVADGKAHMLGSFPEWCAGVGSKFHAAAALDVIMSISSCTEAGLVA